MSEETSQEKPKFDASAWAQANPLQALIVGMLTTVIFSFGTNQVATKAFAQKESAAPAGISQDQADVRYLTKDEADRRAAQRDKQLQAIDEKTVPLKVFNAYHETDQQRMDRMEKLLEQILENQGRAK